MTCLCMGPQGGQPLCPCKMNAARGFMFGNINFANAGAAWPPVPTPESTELNKLLNKAREHVMTPKERYEQQVSWIMGMVPFDREITRDEVVRHLAEMGVVDPEATA